MFGPFNETIKQIVDSVIRPITDWIISRPWPVRLVFLLVIVGVAVTAWRPEVTEGSVERIRYTMRIAFAESTSIPLSAASRENLRLGISRLSDVVEADLDGIGTPRLTPWSASQAAVPIAELNGSITDREKYVNYVRQLTHGDCFCWSERPLVTGDEICLQISGWAMTAFASLREPLSVDELRSVLALQNAEGWWPLFPATERARFSSTYATAWMLFGLLEQREARLIPAELQASANASIRRASRWLLAARRDGARWPMHPNYRDSKTSESVSAFVLFVLHEADVPGLSDIDQEWLDHLPSRELTPHDVETYNENIVANDGISIDRFGQVRLPWILLATIEAYPSGTFTQRARALRWIEQVLNDPAVRQADTRGNDWVRAEALLGLVYAYRRLGI